MVYRPFLPLMLAGMALANASAEEPQPTAPVEPPQPVAEQPAPVAEQPQPVAEEPAPVAEQPQPVAEEPAPVAEQPQPVAEEPAPVAEQPQPVAEEPAPVAEQPIIEEAAPQEPAPPLYDYVPAQVYTVSWDIPLPSGEGWKELAAQPWFQQLQPLRMEFSLVGINFRSEEHPVFALASDLLGGKDWPGITKTFSIGFDPEQSPAILREGSERRPVRLRAGGSKLSSGSIGIPSFTRAGEFDWYLPLLTNEVNVLQYAAIMHPDEPPPGMVRELPPPGEDSSSSSSVAAPAEGKWVLKAGVEALLLPQTRVSRRDAEDFIERLNALSLLSHAQGETPSWNIRCAAEPEARETEIVLGRHFFFALPTSAEWEYAARGGELNARHYGQDYPLRSLQHPQSALLYEIGQPANARGTVSTRRVIRPNCLGLYNMLGNAMEWVDDDRQPCGSALGAELSPAARGEDIGNTGRDERIGFRLVIRSRLYSRIFKRPLGIAPAEVMALEEAPTPQELRAEEEARRAAEEERRAKEAAARAAEAAQAAKNAEAARRAAAEAEQRLCAAIDYISECYGEECSEAELAQSMNNPLCHKALTALQTAAAQQDARALYWLGWCHEKGIGTLASEAEARRCMARAAELGHAMAQFRLGWYEENGLALPAPRPEQAFIWYEKAAAAGNARAQFALGACYEAGIGTERDVDRAVSAYEKAAAQEHPFALFRLGCFYESGTEVPCNLRKAMNCFAGAADATRHSFHNRDTFAESCFRLGSCCTAAARLPEEEGRALFGESWQPALLHARAFNAYQLAANNNHAEAILRMGYCYEYGWGVQADGRLAFHLYLQAANMGLAQAQLRAGFCYASGKYCDRDLTMATFWYKKAAEQDKYLPGKPSLLQGEAHAGLAWVCERRQRRREAINWYKAAALRGNEQAKQRLSALTGKRQK